jgi:hypothetical protein
LADEGFHIVLIIHDDEFVFGVHVLTVDGGRYTVDGGWLTAMLMPLSVHRPPSTIHRWFTHKCLFYFSTY